MNRFLLKAGIFCSYFQMVLFGQIFAQNRFGNEWINTANPYYAIAVDQDGLYRVEYQTLVNAGIPVGTIDASTYQIWHRGKQVAIKSTAVGNTLAPGEALVFYGQKNDGWQDSALYVPTSAQPHKKLSLFSDTSTYFLTWNSIPGNRVQTNAVFPSGSFETNHIQETTQIFFDDYSVGTASTLDPQDSWYMPAEGYMSSRITASSTITFPIENLIGTSMTISGVLAGRNSNANTIEIRERSENGNQLLLTQIVGGNTSSYFEKSFDRQYPGNNLAVAFSQLAVGGDFSVCYISIKYLQSLSMGTASQKVFTLMPNSNNVSSLKIRGANSNTSVWDITNPDAPVEITPFQTEPNEIAFTVPNTILSRKVLLTNNLRTVTSIRKVQTRNFVSTLNTFLALYHSALTKPIGTSKNVVNDYLSYRFSSTGGSYDTLSAEIQQIYDMFSYGEKTPLAIRKFLDFLQQSPSQKPLFLLIMGKGLDNKVWESRFNPSSLLGSNFIPPIGPPGSDILFSSGLGGFPSNVPSIATGRISAKSSLELASYLSKVKQFEATPFELWRKNLVHLNGGAPEAFVISSIASYNNLFKQIAEGPLLGGKVQTLQKRSDAVYQLFDLSAQLKEGLLMINAFGHASIDVTELDIGYPSNPATGYPENGKYPMVLINGCDGGDCFQDYYRYGYNNKSIGEDWTIATNKGAILVLAHVHKGYVHSLGAYSDFLYRTLFTDSIYFSKPFGVVQQHVIQQYYPSSNADRYYYAQTQQMLLQGDPAVVLFGPTTPDYKTSDNEIFISGYNGKAVEAESDSFAVGIVVSNFGRAVNDSLLVCLRRTLPNGQSINYPSQKFKPTFLRDTLFFKIKYAGEESFGLNQFSVSVNCTNGIKETNTGNNSGSYTYFMGKKSIICLQPAEFSITGRNKINFVAQYTNPLDQSDRVYQYEIDTTAKFNSSFKKTGTITSKSLAEWSQTFPFNTTTDTTVVFWRVKATDSNGIVGEWTNSSFTFIPTVDFGWGQSNFDQFYKITSQGILKDSIQRFWKFQNNSFKLNLVVDGAEVSKSGQNNLVQLQGSAIVSNTNTNCNDFGGSGLYGFAINQYDFSPYQIANMYVYGLSNDFIRAYQCRTGGVSSNLINKFLIAENGWQNGLPSSPAYIDLFKKLNELAFGEFFVLFSSNDAQFGNTSVWTPELMAMMENLGAKNFKKLKKGWPYLVVGRKGIPSSVIEVLPDTIDSSIPPTQQTLRFDRDVVSSTQSGSLLSPEFGPSLAWKNVFHQFKRLDEPSIESLSFQIVFRNSSGKDTVLFNGVPSSGMDISWIDAKKFPKLRLKYTSIDTVKVTPAQIKNWFLLADGLPEGTLVWGKAGVPSTLNLLEGDSLKLPFAFKNVSPVPFKSPLVVEYTQFLNNQKVLRYDTLKSTLQPDSVWRLKPVPTPTVGLSGMNSFQIFVNPNLQPEQYLPNNYYTTFFNIQKDNKNPILDVAFDGNRIMNGDIVSPNPVITVNLNDDNPFLLKKDTVGIDLLLKPCQEQGCTFERISLNGPEVVYAPATTSRNKFQVTYAPKNLKDGVYTLRVQAEDASGNRSGLKPYQINFEVVNQTAITNFFPYPNPFSTHMRFAYTLTGNQVPDEIKIQIITPTGKVVKEILAPELGMLKVGTHLTDFVWDGSDEFGDKLANGVYFYKVFARSNGKDMDKRSTSADKAFQDGYGKLYILR